MHRRLLEIRYTFSLLRYAIWASGLTYLGLLLFVCAASVFDTGYVDTVGAEYVTEFAVFVTPALMAIQSAVYFGNTFGRTRIEWQSITIHRQLVDVVIVTLLIFIGASVLFRVCTFVTISPLPVADHIFVHTLWQNTSVSDFFLRGLFALLLSLELFFALVFFGSSFHYPMVALAYQGVTLFALFRAYQYLYANSQATDVRPVLVITGLALLVALPMLFATPKLLTAIARCTNGFRATAVTAVPMIAAIVCFSFVMQRLHQRGLSILRRAISTQDIGALGTPRMYSLAERLNDMPLIDIPLHDAFNHSGSGSECERGLDLLNNRGDVVSLFPDGSTSLVSMATDRPTASPLSGKYPLSGGSIPHNVVATADGRWILGAEHDHDFTTHTFLRFANGRGTLNAALPKQAPYLNTVDFNWGIRAYNEGALIAVQRHKPYDVDVPEGPPLFLYYSSSHLGGESKDPAELGQRSPLEGLRFRLDNPIAPHQLLWVDSQGQHACPLPGILKSNTQLKPFAAVLHGEPFIGIPNTDFTTQVPQTFCHRGGVFTVDISADRVQFMGDDLVVFGTERLWAIRSFNRAPEVVPFPSTRPDGAPSVTRSAPLHMDASTLWYSDTQSALVAVEFATGNTRVLYEPSYASSYIARREGVFVLTGFEWSHVSWQGVARHFGILLFPPGH